MNADPNEVKAVIETVAAIAITCSAASLAIGSTLDKDHKRNTDSNGNERAGIIKPKK